MEEEDIIGKAGDCLLEIAFVSEEVALKLVDGVIMKSKKKRI